MESSSSRDLALRASEMPSMALSQQSGQRSLKWSVPAGHLRVIIPCVPGAVVHYTDRPEPTPFTKLAGSAVRHYSLTNASKPFKYSISTTYEDIAERHQEII